MVIFGIVLIKVWHTECPVWAFFLSLAVGMSSLAVGGMLVLMTSPRLSVRKCYSKWNDSGYYQPTDWN